MGAGMNHTCAALVAAVITIAAGSLGRLLCHRLRAVLLDECCKEVLLLPGVLAEQVIDLFTRPQAPSLEPPLTRRLIVTGSGVCCLGWACVEADLRELGLIVA